MLKDALATMYLADKYMTPDLKEAALKHIIDSLDDNNIWKAYSESIKWNDETLRLACEKYLLQDAENLTGALNSPFFLGLPKDVLLQLLKLHNPDQLWAFNNDEWVKKACSSENELEVLHYEATGKPVFYISEVELFKVCNA